MLICHLAKLGLDRENHPNSFSTDDPGIQNILYIRSIRSNLILTARHRAKEWHGSLFRYYGTLSPIFVT